jgi:hypothetical protein
MQYTEEMILQSKSGYCMPFEEQPDKEVAMTLGYGEQMHILQQAKSSFIMDWTLWSVTIH